MLDLSGKEVQHGLWHNQRTKGLVIVTIIISTNNYRQNKPLFFIAVTGHNQQLSSFDLTTVCDTINKQKTYLYCFQCETVNEQKCTTVDEEVIFQKRHWVGFQDFWFSRALQKTKTNAKKYKNTNMNTKIQMFSSQVCNTVNKPVCNTVNEQVCCWSSQPIFAQI